MKHRTQNKFRFQNKSRRSIRNIAAGALAAAVIFPQIMGINVYAASADVVSVVSDTDGTGAAGLTEAGETAGVTLDHTRQLHWEEDQTLTIGDTRELSGTILETDLAGRKITWSSSNEKVVTVSADGTVTATGEGTATITATAEDGSTDSITFTFHINPKTVNPVEPDNPDQPDSTIPFTDVKKTDYFYDAVVWAYQNQVTSGTSSTTFGPRLSR